MTASVGQFFQPLGLCELMTHVGIDLNLEFFGVNFQATDVRRLSLSTMGSKPFLSRILISNYKYGRLWHLIFVTFR